MAPSKLPRRHAQRRNLCYNRATRPLEGSSSHGCSRAYKAQARTRKPAPDSNSSFDSGSTYESDSEYGSDDHDSGYNSESGRDAKAEHYQQVSDEYAREGLVMPKPGKAADKMMKREEQKWNL